MLPINNSASAGKVLSQLFAESWKQLRIGLHRVERREIQPFHRKTADQAGRARIGEHAAHLRVQHRWRARLAQSACRSDIEQLFIGSLTPEKERETRGQFQII